MWWFLRHGETEKNISHIVQGHLDIPLSPTGLNQIRHFISQIQLDPPPQIVFASPLVRARVTAETIANRYGISEVKVCDDLIEWSLGEAEGDTLENYLKENPGFQIRWDDFDFRYPGGESKRELSQRAVRFVDFLRTEARVPLIVAHQAILNYVISAALGIPDSAAMPFRLGNCGLAAIKPGLPYGRLVLFQGKYRMPWDPPS